ncbi:lytic transglycosylase domain-containing protein [Nocardia sp. NPDC051030]|uniref:aggregation-promoting factor C-terminal-like domain-containing protein n=1 Tax=Nocardia sp. NPDC051030 TaxID=3155162 RepID=UPI00341EC782
MKAFALLMGALVPVAIGCAAPTAQAAPPPIDQAILAELSGALPEVYASLSSGLSSSVVVGLAHVLEPRFSYPAPALKTVALTIVPLDQFGAFDEIITRESGWRVFAVNPTSGAYGLAQALPAEKMFTEGPDWLFNPITQLRWAYRYMVQRYGSPAAAWDFWQAHHWY